MNKQELLKYLKAVCDGESAKYACEEVLLELNAKLNGYMNGWYMQQLIASDSSLQYPPYPAQEPKRFSIAQGISAPTTTDASGVALGCGCATAIAISLLCIGGPFLLSDSILKNVLTITLSPTISGIIVAATIIACVKKYDRNRKELYESEIDSKYYHALSDYKKELAKYEKERNAVDSRRDVAKDKLNAQRDTLRHIISGYEAMKAEIEKQLSALYDRDIIYERFRDIVAVHQIREYLEAGVCDELEGKDGAYALYYNDIRTSKITDSISDLKYAMIDSLDRLGNRLSHSISIAQRSIINELQTTDANLGALHRTIDNSLNGINSRMDGLSHTLDMQRRELSESNAHAQSIERAVTASAYNDYIIKRLNSMGDYDRLHRLKDPRS